MKSFVSVSDVVASSGGAPSSEVIPALKVLVNTCTVGVPLVEEIARAAIASGVTLIDCPISGDKC